MDNRDHGRIPDSCCGCKALLGCPWGKYREDCSFATYTIEIIRQDQSQQELDAADWQTDLDRKWGNKP